MSATATVGLLEGGVKFHTESKLNLLIFLMPMSTVFCCECNSCEVLEHCLYCVFLSSINGIYCHFTVCWECSVRNVPILWNIIDYIYLLHGQYSWFFLPICSLCTQIPEDCSVVRKDALQEGWNRIWEFYWKVVAVLGWVLFQNNVTCVTSLAM